ncbi:MAG: Ig-like domain repeat protein, partial [Pseudonocardia sp.]|nr:Ig-like domain repeat protein [Pseudonocardia sp.]
LPGGDSTVRAAYQGDDVYAPSQAFTGVTLSRGTPLVAAGTTPDPTSGSVDMWATVDRPSGADASAPAPTGSVHFVDTTNGFTIDSGTFPLDANGQVHVPNAFSNAMSLYTFEAIYSGDGSYASVTTSFSVRVLNQTNVSLSSGVNPSKVGQTVPLTATVVDAFGRVPSGTVTFLDGAQVVGTAPLVGHPAVSGSQATLSATLDAGAHSLTARYDGDPGHFGSTSTAITQEVDEAAPPVADAGADVKARKGTTVTLDGTGSTDPQGEPLTYSWVQISGLPATIADNRSGRTAVTLPSKASTVQLRLTVTNAAGLTSTADVTITVSPK